MFLIARECVQLAESESDQYVGDVVEGKKNGKGKKFYDVAKRGKLK